MNIPDLCIYFVIGILSVAYPILLQVVATLDEKYSSMVIVELFKKEIEYRAFRLLLVITLALIASYGIVNLSITLNSLSWLNKAVVYSLFGFTTSLITAFLLFISKILTYYTPSRIVTYFIDKKEGKDYVYFNALGDILYFSIDKKLDGVAKLIHDYYYKAFSNRREESDDKPVVYPQQYYALIINIVSRLAPSDNQSFRFLEYRTIGGVWLLGESKETEISENTYNCLWSCLTTAVKFGRDDMVMLYWANAHQHFIYRLQTIAEEYENKEGENITKNKKEVAKRNKERARFLEFNYALGGLLLYKNRLNCIKRIFTYTSSTPPSYDLLPVHMTQVFQTFFNFWDVYDSHFPFISQRYWYPDTEGLGSENLAKVWTCKYVAILFLRQYSIVEYYTFIKPLQQPQTPAGKSERREWIANSDHLKRLVTEQYENTEALKALGLSFLNDKWLKDQKKITPSNLIDDAKQAAITADHRAAIELQITDKEIAKIKKGTARIIGEGFEKFRELFENKITKDFYGFATIGLRTLLNKEEITDQETDEDNERSFYVHGLVEDLNELVAGSFATQHGEKYHLSEGDLFAAVDRLEPDPEKYVLINFGFDLNYWLSANTFPGLTANRYNSLKLFSFPQGRMGRRIHLLRIDDLPYLFTKKPSQKEIKKYHLELIGEPHIYFSLLDLHLNKAVRDEWLASGQISEEDKPDIEKRAQLYMISQAVIRWKKSARVISLSVTYPYITNEEKSISLTEIPKIDEKK